MFGFDDAVNAGIQLVGKVIDRVIPDPQAAAAAKLKVAELAQDGTLKQMAMETDLAKAQVDVNKAEAASTNWWIAGARPGFMWMGVLAVFYDTIVQPMLTWVSTIHHVPVPPPVDTSFLYPLVMGLLGLGSYRTYEKVKGVNGSHG